MNNKKIAILLALILSLTLGAIGTPAYAEIEDEFYSKEEDIIRFFEILDYVRDNYPFEVEDKTLIENGIKGILQGLDDYSDYYTQEETAQLLKGIMGNFVGIGVYIQEKDGYIEIISPIQNSPAEKAGLKSGDMIISINGKNTKGITLEEASNQIQGVEGTKVTLGIKRKGKLKPISFKITRSNIKVNPVQYKILEEEIGYIKLSEFNSYATINIKKALSEFDKKDIKKLIIDLRDNPGGLLDQAIEISELFIPKGSIVHINSKKEGSTTYVSTLEKPKYKLAVLVNENSASASEIFAGAVKDRKAGTLIGTKTFGKGLVQTMTPLTNGSLIKMTTAEYQTPNQTSINGIGIEPDIKVENLGKEDLQLKEAIKTLSL